MLCHYLHNSYQLCSVLLIPLDIMDINMSNSMLYPEHTHFPLPAEQMTFTSAKI